MAKIIVIAGPTASGKTDFALKYAAEHNGELLNADSRQIYKYMDIGTNKGELTPAGDSLILEGYTVQPFYVEGTKIISWLFDLVKPDQNFTVPDYQRICRAMITEITSRGKVPVLAGGTGLYIDAVIKGYLFQQVLPDTELRKQLQELTGDELFDLYWDADQKSAQKLNESDMFNKVRLIRLIEIARQNPLQKKQKQEGLDYVMYYPVFERAELYAKINARVIKMFEQGFVTEVRNLVEKGYRESRPLAGIGYREVLLHLDGKISHEECIGLVQQGHRNYAARQITWFEGKSRGYEMEKVKFNQT